MKNVELANSNGHLEVEQGVLKYATTNYGKIEVKYLTDVEKNVDLPSYDDLFKQ